MTIELDPCPHRPPCPGCPHYGEPGIAAKPAALLSALAQAAQIPTPVVHAGPAQGFRHRARLMVRGRAASPKVGIFQAGSHRIVDIPNCPIHHPLVNPVARALRGALRSSGLPPYAERPHIGLVRSLQVVVERSSGRAQVVVVANADTPESSLPLLTALADELGDTLHSLWWNGNPQRTNTILGPFWHHHCGSAFAIERFGGADVYFPPGAFGQSHLEMADSLVERVQGWVPDGARVTELHAGCGSFGLGLLSRCTAVAFNERDGHALEGLHRGIEGRPAAERARACVLPGAAAEHLAAIRSADVVLVDPPRRGLEPEVTEALRVKRPDRLIYVSCDPESLRRDLEPLESGGLRLSALEAFACFPYSEHVETVALLRKRAPERVFEGCRSAARRSPFHAGAGPSGNRARISNPGRAGRCNAPDLTPHWKQGYDGSRSLT